MIISEKARSETTPTIVVVSNRGPYEFREEGADVTYSRGGGGLAGALVPAMESYGGLWVATAMTEGDRHVFSNRSRIAVDSGTGKAFEIEYMVFDRNLYRRYYDVVSTSVLWFALHGIFDVTRRPILDRRFDEAWEKSYVYVNHAFAGACDRFLMSKGVEASVAVLVQDYHLFLVPRLLDKRELNHRVIFFLHTAFPGPDLLGALSAPRVREILEGMLHADLIGFHAMRWARNFVSACKQFLGADVIAEEYHIGSSPEYFLIYHRDKRAGVGVFPLGPEPSSLLVQAESPEVRAYEERLRVTDNDFVVVSVERVDPAKNSLRSLRAIDEILEVVPELRGRLKYFLFVYPSRERLIEYKAFEAECASLAKAVNLKWRSGDWEPVVFEVSDSYPRSLAALKCYDALFVNSLADGMNLVAREGPLVNQRDGMLVVSTNTGAAELYGDLAFQVNPFDISEQAAAIEEVWRMSPEARRDRASKIAAVARSHTPKSWLDAQLEAAFSMP
ncbi:MAG: hypothetical protein C4318_01460 [Acidimicrobiia bacterium]